MRDRKLVEDLCQETFLRAFRALAGFDGRARLSTWICSIVHRVALDAADRQAWTPLLLRGLGIAAGVSVVAWLGAERCSIAVRLALRDAVPVPRITS
jgi:DNA-directed RNA polymerase specialized sigma24 family protein